MIRIGLIGAGGIGTVHLSNYAYIKDCKVVALADKSAVSKEKAKHFGVRFYSSVDEMLDREELDVVDVCSPTFLHKEHVMKALAKRKHTICEKPIALKRKDAEEMYALAEKKGVHIYVGQVVRFAKESQVLRNLVSTGEYGKILDASFERLSACPRWAAGGWLFDKSKSGHLPFDLHIHDLDLIVSLLGKPDSYRFTSCGNKDKEYKEQYRFFYKFGDVNVVAEAAWFNADIPFIARWRVYFENAVVINNGNSVIGYRFDKEPRIFNTEEKVKILTGINLPPTGIFLEELSHFIECVKENKASEIITREQILTVVDILETID